MRGSIRALSGGALTLFREPPENRTDPFGILCAARSSVRTSQRIVDTRVFGDLALGQLQLGDGPVDLIGVQQERSEQIVSKRDLGIEADRLFRVGERTGGIRSRI